MSSRVSRKRYAHISDLIEEVQRYAVPQNRIPDAPRLPTLQNPEWAENSGPSPSMDDRRRAPGWFKPREHADDRETITGLPGADMPHLYLDSGDQPTDMEDPGTTQSGIEALAYYAPFHFYSRTHWGIYISDYGIAYLASKMKGEPLGPGDSWMLRAAYWFLWRHEYFHFIAEVAASRLEIITGRLDTYRSTFQDGKSGTHEEALANAHAYLNLSKHAGTSLSAKEVQQFLAFAGPWMKLQPPGYRDYDRWSRKHRDLKRGEREYIRRAIEVRDKQESNYLRTAHTDPSSLRIFERSDYPRIPVVRVPDDRVPWLRSARFFPLHAGVRAIVHTREHPPPHIHIRFADVDEVKLAWPQLEPLEGQRPLTRREQHLLSDYLRKYGREVSRKVVSVFGAAAS